MWSWCHTQLEQAGGVCPCASWPECCPEPLTSGGWFWGCSSDDVQHQWLQKEPQVFPHCRMSSHPAEDWPAQGVLYIPA